MAATAAQAPATEPVPDDRTAAYRQFRATFDAGNFNAALPMAVQVVELSRSRFGAEAPEMVNPLSNLATTQMRLREFGPALDSYREAVKLLELQGDGTNLKLIEPLHGMGVALRSLGRDDDAIVPLKRAVDIIRNRNGLYADAQLPMLNALIDCYMTVGRNEEATREHQYAYTVAETTYGKDNLRLLKPLDKFARWQETLGNYTAARALHARAVEIADANSPRSLLAIDGLRGIARSFRLAVINGETEDAMQSADSVAQITGSRLRGLAGQSTENERMLRDALQRLDVAPGNNDALRGAVLIDLGDWYLTGRAGAGALAAYRDAWRALAAGGDTSALEKPAPVVYRAPQMAVSRKREDPEEFAEATVELHVSFAANGEVRAAAVANPAVEREAAERAVISAVRRALWRPAFSNGEPVASDFTFTERVNIRRNRATN
jgi:tetratricopeptide (TPR) repeat protein